MTPPHMHYTHLFTTTNFTFLTGASHPQEMVRRAAELNYHAIAITDECSLAGIVKAYVAAEEWGIKLLIGSYFQLSNGMQLVVIAPHRAAYAELSGFITLARRRAEKGEYVAHFDDLRFRLQNCLVIWVGQVNAHSENAEPLFETLSKAFKNRFWFGVNYQLQGGEQNYFLAWQALAKKYSVPLVTCGRALMHEKNRKPLQDALTAIRENTSLDDLGTQLESNAEAYLKDDIELLKIYAEDLLHETCVIADLCNFSMEELKYQYPKELVPENLTPINYLKQLVDVGKKIRWPQGIPKSAEEILQKELTLIEEVAYEYYFLTVHDLVRFARSKNILCQGRGSAANSVVCYCLFITEIAPGQINVLFERFISKERDEPPDIDVDFENARREEVIQYIYEKYGRERAAIAATVITYRSRSAIRDLGKALGFEPEMVDFFAKSIAWWDRSKEIFLRLQQAGFSVDEKKLLLFFKLFKQLLGFPRHLSQHVGGFIIAQDKISDLVPIENASMPDRTLIQWDKEDLESMRLLKVDVLALGMLTALRKTLEMVSRYDPKIKSLADIPREDPATYEMLCQADSVGVFQVESRAQMSMLPRLQPRKFYDLVVQIAIVRPGPIQGGMVHPYLRRRQGKEKPDYPSEALKEVLQNTFGVPIFQEQVMRIVMVAAGFSGGRADQLRRAMATWGRNGNLLIFEEEIIQGMLSRGYTLDFAKNLFEQIKGFGEYGFPESHSASFALLCYASSWLKCHHPAAFYCGLLNSLPMGFYSASQLIQDAKRHAIHIFPIDISCSDYDHRLEIYQKKLAIRLGFRLIKSLDSKKAQKITEWRGDQAFKSLKDILNRTQFSAHDMEQLASADALHSLSGHRHQARWKTAALKPYSEFLDDEKFFDPSEEQKSSLIMPAPSIEKDVLDDYATQGLTLRAHPMKLLREEAPFNRCVLQNQLNNLRHGQFVRVAGLVTGRQRPGTAHGTIFVTLEDETGNINVIVWSKTQEHFREALLNSKLLLVKGTVEMNRDYPEHPVIHVLAGHLEDCTERLARLAINSRDFH